MPTKFLVPTDGSTFANYAYSRACDLATREEGSTVTLLAVAPMPMLELLTQRPPFLGEELLTVELTKHMELQAKSWVDTAMASRAPDPRFTVDSKMVMGHPGEVICEVAKEGAYDLIVLGHHGSGKLHRMILGSVCDFVVHHSACSVLIIKGS